MKLRILNAVGKIYTLELGNGATNEGIDALRRAVVATLSLPLVGAEDVARLKLALGGTPLINDQDVQKLQDGGMSIVSVTSASKACHASLHVVLSLHPANQVPLPRPIAIQTRCLRWSPLDHRHKSYVNWQMVGQTKRRRRSCD